MDLIDEDKFQTSPVETKNNQTTPGEGYKEKEEPKEIKVEKPQEQKPEPIIESKSKILYWNYMKNFLK